MEISKVLELARRARDNGDSEGAIRYYQMVLTEKPDDWEAVFYTAYFEAMSTTLLTMVSNARKLSKSISTVIDLVDVGLGSDDEKESALREISDKAIYICRLMLASINKYAEEYSNNTRIRYDYSEEMERRDAVHSLCCSLSDKIHSVFGDNKMLGRVAAEGWKFCHENAEYAGAVGISDVIKLQVQCKFNARIYEPDYYKREDEEARLEAEDRKKPISQKVSELSRETVIREHYFLSNENVGDLTEITIPASIEIIEESAFSGCKNLEYVIFPENSRIKSIGDWAFSSCDSLKSVLFAGKSLKIGLYAFYKCKELKLVDFSGITDSIGISNYAFQECKALDNVIFSPSTTVSSIGANAFSDLRLRSLTVNARRIHYNAFGSFPNLKVLTVPKDCEIDKSRIHFKLKRVDFSKLNGDGSSDGFFSKLKRLFGK